MISFDEQIKIHDVLLTEALLILSRAVKCSPYNCVVDVVLMSIMFPLWSLTTISKPGVTSEKKMSCIKCNLNLSDLVTTIAFARGDRSVGTDLG
jgi:hypothetical protein